MQIKRLQVTNIRNVSRTTLPLQAINIFFGANGSGKTSLLEAVHFLLLGRSFRQTQLRPLLRDGEDKCTVYGELISKEATHFTTLGVSRQRNGGKPLIKLNGEALGQLSDLVQVAPLQILSADSFNLLLGGPGNRRQFLDWGLFHVEQPFYPAWRLAQRALKQRNSLIRHGKIDRDQVALWTREYARYGEQVHQMRHQYIEQLLPLCMVLSNSLLPQLTGRLDIAYSRGWSVEYNDFAEALTEGLNGDLQQGYTRIGPHRADLRVTIDHHAAADVLSRGQLKMLVGALYIAQAELLYLRTKKRSIFLIDDLAAELDDANRRRLCSRLERLGVQVFATSLKQGELMDCWAQPENIQMFHVEHGVFTSANSSKTVGDINER